MAHMVIRINFIVVIDQLVAQMMTNKLYLYSSEGPKQGTHKYSTHFIVH